LSKGIVMKVVMAISLAVTFAVFANCLAKDDYSILQDLHRNIGKDLIIVRKEHAGAQAIIYSVLDQVGQLYTFSKNILEKKEKYRQLLRRAKDHVGSFKNNVTRVEKRAAEYKKRANDVEQRLRESETLVAKLANERNTIEKEQENKVIFTPPKNLSTFLDQSVNIWFTEKRDKQVVLKVDKDAASYFKQQVYFPLQKITKENRDGSLRIETKICHNEEIIYTILRWIPHVHVIKPKCLKKEIKEKITEYLKALK